MSTTRIGDETVRVAQLDRHFALPRIRSVPTSEPLVWLRLGWRDLRANWTLFTAVVSGFMLVAPLLAAGLYEISRRHSDGMTLARYEDSLGGWSRNGGSMALFGLLLALVAIAWERLSAILFALFYDGSLPGVDSFFSTVFLSGDYWSFVIAYVGTGAVLASVVYAMSAISVPALVDRRIDVATAIATSIKAVWQNPAPMALWATLLALMMALGFATLLVGMIVLLPWAAHASWHAYRGLVVKR